jgi:CopG family transcriptional regulator / antitoxin EndoAI
VVKGHLETMRRRLNITLPEETIRLLDQVSRRGDRSRFIDQAVQHYVARRRRAQLKKLLREGAEARAERDLALAHEWFYLDEEAWRKS